MLVCSFLVFSSVWAQPVNLYVSPNGDGNKFTKEAPGSLLAAKEKVKTLRNGMNADINIWLLSGTYQLTAPLIFTCEESGLNGFSVIYKAVSDAKPVISSGKIISGWIMHDVAKTIYKAPVPDSFQTRDFFVNGIRAQRARGEDKPADFTKIATGYRLPVAGFYSGMNNWRNPENIEIVGFTEWRMFRCPVADINDSILNIQPEAWKNATDNKFGIKEPAWVENAYELLDEEGEWYLDNKAQCLYYKPRQGENMADVTAVAGNLEALIEGIGTPESPVQNIHFHGISFGYNTWLAPNKPYGFISNQASYYKIAAGREKMPSAITFKTARNIVFEGNTFFNLANPALEFGEGCQGIIILANTFRNLGASAIEIGGVKPSDHHPDNPSLMVKDNKIVNNYITGTGQIYLCTAAILIGYTANTIIAHNEIHDVPYTGISLGWGWGKEDKKAPTAVKNNKIEYNHIYDYIKKLKDGGGIYVLGDQPGLSINNNYIHHSYQMHAGIYLDNGTRHVQVENNVVANMFSNWIFMQLHVGIFATDNIARNNFSDTPNQLIAKGNTVSNNIVVTDGNWPAAAMKIIEEVGIHQPYK